MKPLPFALALSMLCASGVRAQPDEGSQAAPAPAPAVPAPEAEPEPAPEPEGAAEPEPEPAPAPEPAGLGGQAKVVIEGDVSRVYLLPADGGTPLEPGVVPPGNYAVQVFFSATPQKVKDITLEPDQTLTITYKKSMRFCR